jgi:hypothetical protein
MIIIVAAVVVLAVLLFGAKKGRDTCSRPRPAAQRAGLSALFERG